MTDACVIALDAGTTGVRSRAVFADGRESIASYREFTQLFPEPGRVEHDAVEIWQAMLLTLGEVVAEVDGAVGADNIAAIGITNQRETVLAWNRSTGEPYGTAIVWQDRRTAQRCDELTAAGALPMVRERTGLVLDPYFSGTKIEWLLTERDIPVDVDLAIGTIDAWLIWNLTGGTVFATDVTNASRTMLCDIRSRQWDRELCELLHVPIACLPEIVPSSGRIGVTASLDGVPAGIPISGVAGDQQAALFGQACVQPGMAKNTYGTGSFVLLNVGETCPPPAEGMLTTVAWTLADGTDALRPRGLDLRHRIGDPVAARRAGTLRRCLRGRAAGCLGRRLRWRVRRAGVHRARIAVVGPLRPRDDRGHQSRCRASAPHACRRGVDGVPDARRGRRDGGRQRHGDHRSSCRRRRLGDGPAVSDPSRSARGDGAAPDRP